jgi:hypothetical protein
MNLWSSTEPLEDDSFYRILRTRNGELCYDSPNTPNTPSHEYQRMCEMEYKLKVIFGELKQHIDAFVVKKYTRG